MGEEVLRVNVFVLEDPVSFNPTEIDFGQPAVGDSVSQTVQISNLIDRPLSISLAPTAGITLDAAAFDLGIGEIRTVGLTYVPGPAGALDEDLDIAIVDDAEEPEVSETRTIQLIARDPSPGGGTGLQGDFDENGIVDFNDFLLFVGAFGTTESRFDLDADGDVGFSDFLIFVLQFGKRL